MIKPGAFPGFPPRYYDFWGGETRSIVTATIGTVSIVEIKRDYERNAHYNFPLGLSKKITENSNSENHKNSNARRYSPGNVAFIVISPQNFCRITSLSQKA